MNYTQNYKPGNNHIWEKIELPLTMVMMLEQKY